MLTINDADIKKILTTWSKEIQLFLLDKGPFRCECGCDYQLTVGKLDRVRCPGCNTILNIEL